MGMYIDGKPVKPPENRAADVAAAEAAEIWQRQHADDVPVEPTFDERRKQTNYFDRSETVVVDAPTFKVTQYSDGTVRKDNRQPPAPKPKPVTVDSEFRYTPEDRKAMANNDLKTVQVTEHGIQVTEKNTTPASNPSWFSSGPRTEFGDDFRRR